MKRLFATTLRTHFSLIILITTFDLFVPHLVHQQTSKTIRLDDIIIYRLKSTGRQEKTKRQARNDSKTVKKRLKGRQEKT